MVFASSVSIYDPNTHGLSWGHPRLEPGVRRAGGSKGFGVWGFGIHRFILSVIRSPKWVLETRSPFPMIENEIQLLDHHSTLEKSYSFPWA